MRMTRRHVLILAAAVALLLMTVDVHALFAARFLHDPWGWLRALCDRLAEPLPMALVTVGAALLLTRDDARLPVVVNLAAALLLGTALEWLGAPHAPGGLLCACRGTLFRPRRPYAFTVFCCGRCGNTAPPERFARP